MCKAMKVMFGQDIHNEKLPKMKREKAREFSFLSRMEEDDSIVWVLISMGPPSTFWGMCIPFIPLLCFYKFGNFPHLGL